MSVDVVSLHVLPSFNMRSALSNADANSAGAFSIPPPNVKYGGSGDGSDWEGMSNRVWGSHVCELRRSFSFSALRRVSCRLPVFFGVAIVDYKTVEMFNKNNPTREHTASMERPMALTEVSKAPKPFPLCFRCRPSSRKTVPSIAVCPSSHLRQRRLLRPVCPISMPMGTCTPGWSSTR